MNFLNAAAEKKKRLKVELTIAQKWEIIEYSKKFPKATQKSLILKFNNEFKTTMSLASAPQSGLKIDKKRITVAIKSRYY
jgi:hypothetical protein